VSSLTLHIEEPSGLRRERWPATRGVPFPPGALDSSAHLRLLAEAGEEVPLQATTLACWPDGSVRWALLHFQADLAPQAVGRFHLDYGPEVQAVPAVPGVQVTQADGQITLDTGPLQAVFSTAAGFGLLDQVWLEGQPRLQDPPSAGVELVDASGRVFSTRHGVVTAVAVEEAGPLRAVVRLEGDHRTPQGERLFRYEARWYAYAGHPWLELEYTFINDADANQTELQRIGLALRPAVGRGRHGLCGAYRDLYESPDDLTLVGDVPSSFGVFAGLRIYDHQGQHQEVPYPGELSHKIAQGWLDLSDEHGGLTVGLRHAVEMHPKQLALRGDRLEVDLWPVHAGPLRWHQGMARTHQLWLCFHPGTGQAARVNQLAVCFEQALLPWAPGWYAESGALGPLLPYQPQRYPGIEIALRDQFMGWHHGNRALGFLDYGDHPQHGSYARANYMANNEIDLPHVLALQYARVGEELYYQDLEAAAWHLMDVDIVHHTTHSPLELGGARIHGDAHVQYNCEGYEDLSVTSSHMWTEGLLEYYYLSGHPRALHLARGIGDCLLRMLDLGWGMPPYKVIWHSVRDSGWPLIALCALHEATGEARWLDGARRIVDALLAAWNEDEDWGLWLGWHRSLAPMHLGIVGTGLARYHALTGETRAREALLRAMDVMLRKCAHPDGALMYVDNPGWRWNYYSGVAYEALGEAWALTGDLRYLQAGWRSHRRNLVTQASLIGTTLADWWRGNLRYMAWADRAGLLTDLPV
jgi:hypothetical protein